MPKYMRFMLGLLLLSSTAGAVTLDDMVRDLAGPDGAAQAHARQFLPREGYPAAERILPLLSNEEQPIWRTAYNVLADIANESTIPGRETEQAKLATLFASLVAPQQPEALKIRGLDLLTIVTPPTGNVKPIAALLGDPALRERARAALQAIGSPKACAALRAGIRKSDPEFQAALLQSLAICRDPKSVGAAKKMLNSPDAGVRAAAAHAVAWTGDAGLIEPLRTVRTASNEATHFEATDALLRHGDALARSGKTAEAVNVYTELVKTEPNPALAGAALASLIRYADASAAETVTNAITGEKHAQFEPVAVAAFEARNDAPGADLLLAVYPATSPGVRTLLVGVMGRQRNAAFQETLSKALNDPAYRIVAANALADSRQPGAAYLIANAMNGAKDDERAALQATLQRMAKACREDSNPAIAGEAHVALYRTADAPEIRLAALESLMKQPTVDSLDIIVPALEKGELANADPASFVSLADTLAKAGRNEDAARIAVAMAANAKTTQGVQNALNAAKGMADITSKLGFVTKWTIVGPFPNTPQEGFRKIHIGEPIVDLNATYTVDGKTLKWAPIEAAKDSGVVDFGGPYGVQQNTAAFALAKVNVPADTDAVVRCGSDDGIKVWVNGAVVHENLIDRGTALDSDQAPVQLKAGANDILVEVTQGGGGWAFVLRLTKPDGTPIAITQ